MADAEAGVSENEQTRQLKRQTFMGPPEGKQGKYVSPSPLDCSVVHEENQRCLSALGKPNAATIFSTSAPDSA